MVTKEDLPVFSRCARRWCPYLQQMRLGFVDFHIRAGQNYKISLLNQALVMGGDMSPWLSPGDTPGASASSQNFGKAPDAFASSSGTSSRSMASPPSSGLSCEQAEISSLEHPRAPRVKLGAMSRERKLTQLLGA